MRYNFIFFDNNDEFSVDNLNNLNLDNNVLNYALKNGFTFFLCVKDKDNIIHGYPINFSTKIAYKYIEYKIFLHKLLYDNLEILKNHKKTYPRLKNINIQDLIIKVKNQYLKNEEYENNKKILEKINQYIK